MPGIGKTQLAPRYAALSYNRQQYSAVFWISGATVERLNQGFAKVLTLVGHADRDHLEQGIRLTSARRWLEESGIIKWLLVLDNIAQEGVTFIQEHLPRKNSSGNILLTTRTSAVAEVVASVAGQRHQTVKLQPPSLKDARNQLMRDAGIDMNRTAEATGPAEALVKCVGSLPLAISHMASFAKQSHKDLDEVLQLYQSTHQYEVSFNPSFWYLVYADGV
jgi:hypothetical protein